MPCMRADGTPEFGRDAPPSRPAFVRIVDENTSQLWIDAVVEANNRGQAGLYK